MTESTEHSRKATDRRLPYRIGLPAWAYAGWEHRYFDGNDRLRQYASVFSTVEGNTTFYATPSAAVVQDWRAQVNDLDFRFCFKLPREVTHQRGGRRALAAFLAALRPLEPWLGPFLVQLPAVVGPEHVRWIRGLLAALPGETGYALEVRHPDFFATSGRFAAHFGDLEGCLRTIMDARPIHREDPEHPEVLAARHEKPDLPVHIEVGPAGALVRLVLHPDEARNSKYYDTWVAASAAWLAEDRPVYMMIHCPNNQHCPGQAQKFQAQLATQSPAAGTLPPWPVAQPSLFQP